MTCPIGACISCDLLRRVPVERSEPVPAVEGPRLEFRRALPHEVHALREQGWHAGAASSHSEGHGYEVVMVREAPAAPKDVT
jgi:hypothetical protein